MNIIITASGGVVTAVYADTKRPVNVTYLDYDNTSERESLREDRELERRTEKRIGK